MQDQRADDLRAYSGYLMVNSIDEGLAREILRIGAEQGVQLEVSSSAVEVEFVGRDANRHVVQLLLRLAELLQDARGEVECRITDDDLEARFEFFQIRRGKLIRQRAVLVRGEEEELDDKSLRT